MVDSMKLITVVVIISHYILLSEGQADQPTYNETLDEFRQPTHDETFDGFRQPTHYETFDGFRQPTHNETFDGFRQPTHYETFDGFRQPIRNETLDEFQKRCQKEIKTKFVEEKFPDVFTQQYTDTMKLTRKMKLPNFDASFTDKGQPGKLSLKDGSFNADVTLKNGFSLNQSQFTYSFKIPVVDCIYNFTFEQSNLGSTHGHVFIHILDLIFSIGSSTQINGAYCKTSNPTIGLSVSKMNYLVKFLRDPSNSPVASNVTEEVINSFVGTHQPPIENSLRSVLTPLLTTVWSKALQIAMPVFPIPLDIPNDPQHPDNILCQSIRSMGQSPRSNSIHDRHCPEF